MERDVDVPANRRKHSRSSLEYRALTSRRSIKLPDIYNSRLSSRWKIHRAPRDVRYRQSLKSYFHNIYLKCLRYRCVTVLSCL